jgi:hypothetical protein
VYTKSSIMLGLGETEDEIIDTMFDLKVGGLTMFDCQSLGVWGSRRTCWVVASSHVAQQCLRCYVPQIVTLYMSAARLAS